MVQVPELHRGTTCAIRAFKAPGALRADRAPRGFQLHEEVPFLWSSGTIQTSQSSISSHPAFPDVVKPMFLPEIHTKDYFQRSGMRGEYPKRKGECPERISPDWIYTNCLWRNFGNCRRFP